MSTDFTSKYSYQDYNIYNYNSRKNIRKAGFIGAGIGLISCAGLQYGLSELLKNQSSNLTQKAYKAFENNKLTKTKAKLYTYLITCTNFKWLKTGVAGVIGATIVGLATALSKAKQNLP